MVATSVYRTVITVHVPMDTSVQVGSACQILERVLVTANDGSKRSCFIENESDFAMASRLVTATRDGGHDAAPAAVEACNGIDDDCNGFVDDGLPASQPCTNTNGFGSCDGNAVCYGTLGWFCQAPEASAESCDYIDNDCDGLTDEDFKSGDVYASGEHCGECNKGCEGSILNGEAYCDVDAPIPQCVVDDCVDGWEKFNDFLCIPVTSTICEPCVTDEQCLVEGAACKASMTVTSALFHVLGPRTVRRDRLSAGRRFPATGVFPIRQHVPAMGLIWIFNCPVMSLSRTGYGRRQRASTTYCTAAGWSACELPEEICNYLDDNCDGTADESFKNDLGQYASDEHCGQCNANWHVDLSEWLCILFNR